MHLVSAWGSRRSWCWFIISSAGFLCYLPVVQAYTVWFPAAEGPSGDTCPSVVLDEQVVSAQSLSQGLSKDS